MLRTSIRILAAVAVAAAFAAPVAAHRKSNMSLDPRLVELTGEIISVDRRTGPDEPTHIDLLIKNTSYQGERLPGHDAIWSITVDTQLLRDAGVTKPMLLKQKKATILGYKLDDKLCNKPMTGCDFAGRQIRFETGCTVFIGRPEPVFGVRTYAYGRNLPKDGLEKAGQPKCFED
jgi:hypothetical protein